jgi:hypothetical protein
MQWFFFISTVALAGQLAVRADSPESGKPARGDAGMDRPGDSGGVVTLPSVWSKPQAVDGVVITLPGSAEAIAKPLPELAKVAETAVRQTPPADEDRPPVLRRAKPVYPAGFERDSALFCQEEIGQWTEADAVALLGEPARQRLALGREQSETGLILGFADPTGRYQELELDFNEETGSLRTVFAYPWKMTWQECRRLWGAKVTAAEANQGRIFYSYLNRRLDVLVDRGGKVISLGLY